LAKGGRYIKGLISLSLRRSFSRPRREIDPLGGGASAEYGGAGLCGPTYPLAGILSRPRETSQEAVLREAERRLPRKYDVVENSDTEEPTGFLEPKLSAVVCINRFMSHLKAPSTSSAIEDTRSPPSGVRALDWLGLGRRPSHSNNPQHPDNSRRFSVLTGNAPALSHAGTDLASYLRIRYAAAENDRVSNYPDTQFFN
jgi:hypothetical protein